jgi:hypothetical protein
MATGMPLPLSTHPTTSETIEPSGRAIFVALTLSMLFVFATRWPVARPAPFEFDEFGFLAQAAVHWFPMHHTLFMTLGRALGLVCSNPYQGFVLLDMLTSAGALVSVWWMLRSLVRPATAAAAAFVLGVSPVFWCYGAMAGNYTAIVLVGSFLLGVAYRDRSCPKAWHPFAAAIVLAIGTGYRQDIGTFWLPVFSVILWQHRWKRALGAGLLFTVLNLAWLAAMLYDVGGWDRYRAASAEFAHQAGYLNSVWNLGFIDGPVRYAVKITMALAWTLGPALLFIPRGSWQLARIEHARLLGLLLAISIAPALASHLLIHFGVTGYAFHYLPALMVLVALGVRRGPGVESKPRSWAMPSIGLLRASAPARLVATAIVLAAMFWYYPTDYSQPGWRGNFDLSFCRSTRIGLSTPLPDHGPQYWRTANSRPLAGTPQRRPPAVRAGSG